MRGASLPTLRALPCAVACAALAGAVLIAAADPARADPSLGPPLGSAEYVAAIQSFDADPDVDDYVVELIQGETLTVTVAATKNSALLPDLSLVRPDGTVLAAPGLPVVPSKGGRKVTLRSFAADASGTWTVRVAGADATWGEYTLKPKVKAPKPVTLKGSLDAAGSFAATFDFAGIAGATADVTLKWKPKGAEVDFTSFRAPDGAEIPGTEGPLFDESRRKGSSRTFKDVVLPGPAGMHRLAFASDVEATFTVEVAVKPPKRVSSKKPIRLFPVEPRITAVASPRRVAAGFRVTIAGAGFSSTDVPLVFFGDARATNVVVASGGISLDADVPEGTDGSTVAVSVQNPDGQAGRRDAFAFYVPPATVTDVTDLAGAAVRVGSTAGGRRLHLRGENLQADYALRFGGAAASSPVLVDATTLEFQLPARGAGMVDVTLTDDVGRTATAPFQFEFKSPPALATTPYAPEFGALAGGTVVTVTGTGFSADDVLAIDSVVVPTTFVNPTSFRFTSPAKTAGKYKLTVTDRAGSVAPGPNFEVKAPPSLTSSVAVSGTFLPPNHVPFVGGPLVRVGGAAFRTGDTTAVVTASGTTVVARTAESATQFEFVVPASTAPGGATLTVTDAAGQTATLTDALRYVGYQDDAANRVPAASSTDDFSALRALFADLDLDAAADDVAIVSDGSSPGSRQERTRLLFGANGTLGDATSGNVPSAFSDPAQADDWRASALAIGDLDRANGADLVLAGSPVAYYDPGSYSDVVPHEVRILVNDGTGTFTFDDAMSPSPGHAEVTGVYYGASNYYYTLLEDATTIQGVPTTNDVALGDLDADGNLEIVSCSALYRASYLYVDPAYLDLATPGVGIYELLPGFTYSSYGTYTYRPSLRIHEDRGASFEETSFPRLPLAGTPPSTLPAFPGRDVELGDLDGDDDLDVVVTWDDPTTTTPYGIFTAANYGTSSDSARTATGVLLNDGTGFFSDATSDWLPAAASPEFWQGHRLALADLDGDGDLDLVLLLAKSTDAFQGTPTFTKHALRILRNDGAATGFTDVTAAALPSVPLAGSLDDNLRGTALAVGDVNGDSIPDLLVGTTDPLRAPSNATIRRTRLLLGKSGLTFVAASDFLPPVTVDSGEADDLRLGDVLERSDPSLLLVTESNPATSAGSRKLRVFDWNR